MRAIWKGHISFALVSIPVSLYSATRSSDIALKYLHKKDLSPLSYRRFCDQEDVELEWDEVTRGYEFEKGRFVEVTREELDQANASLTRSIQIVEFVDIGDIDPIYFDKPYYLEPQAGGEHAYGLFAEALAQSEKVGVARVVLKTREHLAAVRPLGHAMTMQTLRFSHEIVAMNSLRVPEASGASPKEMELAETLIGTMSSSFDPSKYKDEYREQLLEVIQKKVAGEVVASGESVVPAPPGRVIDLMEVLKKSLKARKEEHASLLSREKTQVAGRRKRKGPTPARNTR